MAILLCACASPPIAPPSETHDWDARSAAVSQIHSWHIQGKLGFRSPQQSGSALLDWQQQEDEFELLLSGAMGIGRNRFKRSEDGILWTDSDGESHFFNEPEQAVLAATGIAVPVNALRFWVRGIPAPDLPYQATDPLGNPAHGFSQRGWLSSFDRYTTVNGVLLPTRIKVTRNEIELVVVISRWQLTQLDIGHD